MNTLAPQYSLYIYTFIALIFTWETVLVLSKRKLVSSYLINFRKRAGIFMSYLIMALIGMALAIGYWWGIQKIFVTKKSTTIEIPAKTQPTAEEIAKEVLKNIPNKPEKHAELEKEPAIILQLPSTGNLKQRAIDLSNEILEDLYWHGWPLPNGKYRYGVKPMPETDEGRIKWAKSRSDYFHFRFLTRVREIRDEFVQFHLRDKHLDNFFQYYDMSKNLNQPIQGITIEILPQDIERIAESLKALAEQTKQ